MKRLLLSFVLITILNQAKAQWNGNTSTNNAVVSANGIETRTGLVSINDGNNNMIIAWIDDRNTSTGDDIYIQKINKDGSLPWGAEKIVCNAANNQGSIALLNDGSNGVIVAWSDRRSGTTSNDDEVYGQRVNSDGTMAWTSNGVLLTKAAPNSSVYRRNPVLEKVSTTEFLVVFSQFGTSADLFAQKNLIADGSPVWSADTDIHGAQANSQTTPQILADGSGGAYVVWGDPRLATSNADIYGQKINSDGTVAWGASGKIICSASFNQLNPVVVSDNSGGLVVAWSDLRNGTSNGDVYVQRLNSSGVGQWGSTTAGSEGLMVCSSPNTSLYIKLINSGTDYILVWTDQRTSGTTALDVYAQKLNASGVAQWNSTAGAEGVAVVTAAGSQANGSSEFTLIDNGAGTAWVTWSDPRISTSDYNIFAQKLNTDGTVAFATDGVLISNATGNQRTPNAISDGAGGLINAWQDSRTSSSGEIYASRLYSNGTLPVIFTKVTAGLNTNQSVTVKWNLASEINTQKYVIERAGDGGVFSSIGEVSAKQLNSYSFVDIQPILGNNYYRIRGVDFDGTLSFSDVTQIKLSGLNVESVVVYPNPTVQTLNIKIQNWDTFQNEIQVKIIDMKGVVKSQQAFNSQNNQLNLEVGNLNPGIYMLQLQDKMGKSQYLQNFIKL